MKQFHLAILLIYNSLIFSQTGMGTPAPRGALDINRPLTNTFGLVLPTNSDPANMVNPQGGTLAIGTMMYDSQMNCIKYFNGTAWSNCLVDAPPPTPLVLDCSAPGFVGVYKSSVALSGASFRVTITNNSLTAIGPITFQSSDVVLSGVNGITISSVSPTSASFSPGQSRIITYYLAGTPITDGALNATLSKVNLSCTSSVQINKVVRFAYWNNDAIGGNFSAFNSQLTNPVNYGTTGKRLGNFGGFSFTSITSTLANLTVQNLLDRYDIICIAAKNMTTAEAAKIKGYVDGGGVAIILFESYGTGTNLFNAFGGTGSVGNGSDKGLTNANPINNGIFGNGTNVSLNGSGSDGALINMNQLPPNAISLAQSGVNAGTFIAGNDGKAIFFWEDDIFTHTTIGGNVIDTPQEFFLHNVMDYALGKAGL